MPERELPGVEHLPRIITGAFTAIQFITKDWMAEVMEMDADLMGAARVQDAFDEAYVAVRAQNAIFGFGGAPLASRDAHPLPVNGMPLDGFVDDSGSLAGSSRNEREINFRHRPRGKLVR